MKSRPLPPREFFCELLSYDATTGIFSWKVARANRVPMGRIAGSKHKNGYIHISILERSYKAHRVAWLMFYGQDPGDYEIDHRDRNRSNNAIKNLRLATNKQNKENFPAHRDGSSGIRGVSYHKNEGTWEAYITHNKKRRHLGSFKTIDEAAAARRKAEAEMFTHGEWASA